MVHAQRTAYLHMKPHAPTTFTDTNPCLKSIDTETTDTEQAHTDIVNNASTSGNILDPASNDTAVQKSTSSTTVILRFRLQVLALLDVWLKHQQGHHRHSKTTQNGGKNSSWTWVELQVDIGEDEGAGSLPDTRIYDQVQQVRWVFHYEESGGIVMYNCDCAIYHYLM